MVSGVLAGAGTIRDEVELLTCRGGVVTEYIRKVRVREACRLLLHTAEQLADIAFDCGFMIRATLPAIFGRMELK